MNIRKAWTQVLSFDAIIWSLFPNLWWISPWKSMITLIWINQVSEIVYKLNFLVISMIWNWILFPYPQKQKVSILWNRDSRLSYIDTIYMWKSKISMYSAPKENVKIPGAQQNIELTSITTKWQNWELIGSALIRMTNQFEMPTGNKHCSF